MYFLEVFFFFKQKTAYELRISDWSSDVCSSDLPIGYFKDRKIDLRQRHQSEGEPAQPHCRSGAWHRANDRGRPLLHRHSDAAARSDERRVGKECGRTCRSRWSAYREKNNKNEASRLASGLRTSHNNQQRS